MDAKSAAKVWTPLAGQRHHRDISQSRGHRLHVSLQCSPRRSAARTWEKIRPLNLQGRVAASRDADTAREVDRRGRDASCRRAIPITSLERHEPDGGYSQQESVKDYGREARGEASSRCFLRLSRETTGVRSSTIGCSAGDMDELAISSRPRRKFLPSIGDAGATVPQITMPIWATFTLHGIKEEKSLQPGTGHSTA